MKDKFKRLKEGVSNRNNRIPLIMTAIGVFVVATAAAFVIRAYLVSLTQVKENPFGPMTYTDFDLDENFTSSVDWTQADETDVDIKISKDEYDNYIKEQLDDMGIWTRIDSANGTPFYYYNRIVLPVYDNTHGTPDPDGITLPMFTYTDQKNITVRNAKKIPEGAQVRITVIADCVQAVSIDNANWREMGGRFSAEEVQLAWGKTPTGASGGALPSVGSTGEGLKIEWPTT